MSASTIKERLADYPDVSFIEELSFSELQSAMLANYQEKYQELTGEEITLAAADPMRLTLYSCAVMIYQAFQMEDWAGKQGLLKYSTGDFLDNLGALKSVTRNSAQAAATTLCFTLSAVQANDVKIPKGTRTRTGDLFFATTEAVVIKPGETDAEVMAACQTEGETGNGIAAGTIKILVDPINYVKSVTNITQTTGGADREDDESLAERIYLAPSGYSVAGPAAAYDYWVKTYSQQIGDSYIGSNAPGEVNIYVLCRDGEIPETDLLEGLEKYISSNDIRPLTDKVTVQAAEVQDYNIDLTYYIGIDDESMEDTIKKETEAACQQFVQWQKEKIGRDINPSYLTHLLITAGAKWVDIREPVFQTVPNQAVAFAETLNLVYGGLQDD